MTIGDRPTFKKARGDGDGVSWVQADRGSALRVVVTASLALAMIASMWGPITPHAGASQFDDLGTNDPNDVEGIEEPPWRAWETQDLSFLLDRQIDVTVGPQDRAYITWGQKQDIRLAYPHDDGEPGASFGRVAVNVNGSAEPGGVAVQDNGRIWATYTADGLGSLAREVYVATTMDPGNDEWTRYRLADDGWNPRIAIDDTGTVHVVYGTGDQTLRHATYASGPGWHQSNITQVPPHGPRDHHVAIEAGRLHVVWAESVFDNPEHREGYAVKPLDDDAEWTVEQLPYIPDDCTGDPDVGAAPDGSAWISCRGHGGITAWHRAVNGTWSQEHITDGSDLLPPRRNAALGGGTGIAVDDDGVPHVVFRTKPPFGFKNSPTRPGQPQYAARVDGVWTTETINRYGQDNGQYPSIAVDSQGRPHVAYQLWTRFDDRPGHPCPGCKEVNDRFRLEYARPLAATLDAELG